jgi:pimeloyl-ACP methyl ester carboxylesterase
MDDVALIRQAAAELGLATSDVPPVRRTEVIVGEGEHLSALIWGDGLSEFVFVHGGSQNAHTWDAVTLLLGRPCVAVDLPGHGQSSWRQDGTYDPRVMSDAVADAIRRLTTPPIVLVGMSLGGLTSMTLAARHPELVSRLVVVDVTPAAGGQLRLPKADPREVSFGSIEEAVDRVYASGTGRSRASFTRGVVANTRQRADGRWVWKWDPAKTMSKHQVRWADVWQDVAVTQMPFLFVRAGSSRVVCDDDMAELRRRRPDVEVVEIPGAAHSVQGSKPRELAAELARLAQPHDRSPARRSSLKWVHHGKEFESSSDGTVDGPVGNTVGGTGHDTSVDPRNNSVCDEVEGPVARGAGDTDGAHHPA